MFTSVRSGNKYDSGGLLGSNSPDARNMSKHHPCPTAPALSRSGLDPAEEGQQFGVAAVRVHWASELSECDAISDDSPIWK